jgi:phage/plasmid-like protein (TIGR03299 family)
MLQIIKPNTQIITNVNNEINSPISKVGKKVKGSTCLEEAIVAAGMDWSVEAQTLTTPSGIVVPNKAIVRQDTGKVLGVVGQKYQIIQNEQAFGFFNNFLKTGQAVLESAGSIKDGKRIFIQAKIQRDPLTVQGDDSLESYILLGNAHDGSMALNIGFFPYRAYCANILSTQTVKASNKMLRFRHTPNIHENLDQIAAVMNLANAEFEATVEQFRFLARNSSINEEKLRNMVKIIFAGDNYLEKEKEDGKEAVNQVVNSVVALYENGRGTEDTPHSYWRAYNAVNEYLCHEKGAQDDVRLNSLVFGQSKTLDKRALDIAVKLAA